MYENEGKELLESLEKSNSLENKPDKSKPATTNKTKENLSFYDLRKLNNKTRRRAKSISKSKRKNVIIVGAVFILFASLGFFQVGSYFFGEISGIVTGRNRSQAYEKFIQPIVLMDVVPFESVDKLDEKTIIQIAIWSLIIKGNLDKYVTEQETGRLLIPYIDIESEATNLFGSGLKFTHETFADFENTFYYDDSTASYKIPITGRVGYVPSVSKIENKDGLVRLTVNYIPPKAWSADIKGNINDPVSSKSLYYYIDKKNNKEFVTKVETIPEPQ